MGCHLPSPDPTGYSWREGKAPLEDALVWIAYPFAQISTSVSISPSSCVWPTPFFTATLVLFEGGTTLPLACFSSHERVLIIPFFQMTVKPPQWANFIFRYGKACNSTVVHIEDLLTIPPALIFQPLHIIHTSNMHGSQKRGYHTSIPDLFWVTFHVVECFAVLQGTGWLNAWAKNKWEVQAHEWLVQCKSLGPILHAFWCMIKVSKFAFPPFLKVCFLNVYIHLWA